MRAIIVILSVVWSGFAYSQSPPPMPRCLEGHYWPTTLNVDNNNRFIMNILVNGRHVDVVVDSGAYIGALPNSLIKSFKLTDLHKTVSIPIGNGNKLDVSKYSGTINIGRVSIPNVNFANVETGDKKNVGLIPFNFLFNYAFYIDTEYGRLILIDTIACNGDYNELTVGYSTVKIYINKYLQGFFVDTYLNGIPMHALLDTGSSITHINTNTAHILGISDEKLQSSDKKYTILVGGEKLISTLQRIETLTFAGVDFHNVDVFCHG